MKPLLCDPKCESILYPLSITNHRLILTHPIPSNFPIVSNSRPKGHQSAILVLSHCHSIPRSAEQDQAATEDAPVQDLTVPDNWLLPSKALEESEWLRVTLQKWLDDEYCPEDTNVEISRVAAESYYQSLLDKQTSLGEILLKMANNLLSISYQESFHGPFSSANAAVNLIAQRVEQQLESDDLNTKL